MNADHFRETLTELTERVPFQMFTIELNTGEQLQVDHTLAIAANGGRAVFIGPGGKLQIFDSESVNQVIFDATSADAEAS